jgi:hypothetical protein
MITFTNISPEAVKAWESTTVPAVKNLRANEIVRVCEDLVVDLEAQLEEAVRDLAKANALKHMTAVAPTWQSTLGNLRITTHQEQQVAADSLGYSYYVFNGEVFTKTGISLALQSSDLK